jgi:hypothetical protein
MKDVADQGREHCIPSIRRSWGVSRTSLRSQKSMFRFEMAQTMSKSFPENWIEITPNKTLVYCSSLSLFRLLCLVQFSLTTNGKKVKPRGIWVTNLFHEPPGLNRRQRREPSTKASTIYHHLGGRHGLQIRSCWVRRSGEVRGSIMIFI